MTDINISARRILFALLLLLSLTALASAGQTSVVYQSKDGPGKGKHIVFLSFQIKEAAYKDYSSFGKRVLGEQWVNHWGNHKKEATKGIIEASAKDDPILRGVTDVFGDSDVYEAYPPADAKILIRGQVLAGMKPGDPPAKYAKKRTSDGIEQDVNDPMMPIAWTRLHRNEAGRENRIVCTTMGAATD